MEDGPFHSAPQRHGGPQTGLASFTGLSRKKAGPVEEMPMPRRAAYLYQMRAELERPASGKALAHVP